MTEACTRNYHSLYLRRYSASTNIDFLFSQLIRIDKRLAIRISMGDFPPYARQTL